MIPGCHVHRDSVRTFGLHGLSDTRFLLKGKCHFNTFHFSSIQATFDLHLLKTSKRNQTKINAMLFWYSSGFHSCLLYKPKPVLIAQIKYIPPLKEQIHGISSTSPRQSSHNPPKTNCNTGMQGTTHIPLSGVQLHTAGFFMGNSWRRGTKLNRYE